MNVAVRARTHNFTLKAADKSYAMGQLCALLPPACPLSCTFHQSLWCVGCVVRRIPHTVTATDCALVTAPAMSRVSASCVCTGRSSCQTRRWRSMPPTLAAVALQQLLLSLSCLRACGSCTTLGGCGWPAMRLSATATSPATHCSALISAYLESLLLQNVLERFAVYMWRGSCRGAPTRQPLTFACITFGSSCCIRSTCMPEGWQ